MPSCPHCHIRREFRDTKMYLAHVKENHYAGESRRFQCLVCPLTFHRIQRFEVHVLNCFKKNSTRKPPMKNATQVNLPVFNIEPFNVTSIDIPETGHIANPPRPQATSTSTSSIFHQIALEFSLVFAF
jgi:hypothetical protein